MSPGSLRVGFVLCPEFPLMSLTGFVEALRHAADRGDLSRKRMCTWTIMTVHGQSERSSCGLSIAADRMLDSSREFDLVVLIGPLLRQFETLAPGLYDFLHATRARQIPIAGLCTGAFVLAEAGFLAHRLACIHPYHALDFSHRFPTVAYRTDLHFLETDGITTVPGGTSVLNYASHVIEYQLGVARASKVMHQMSLPGASLDVFAARQFRPDPPRSRDARVQKAVSLMERAMEAGGPIAHIAAAVGVSERQLDRLFRQHLGTPPKRYWLDMRLDYCKWLILNTDRSITDVAFLGGFSDSAHFITRFKTAFGAPPGEMRRNQRQPGA